MHTEEMASPPPVGTVFDDEVEKSRIARPADGAVPFRPFPTTFEDSYDLPEHRDRLLSRAHPFPFDTSMVFHEAPHLYVCENGKTIATASVSGLLKPFKSEFNAPAIITTMLRSRSYPKLPYAVNATLVTQADLPDLDPSEQVVVHDPVTDDHVFTGLFGDAPRIAAHYEVYTYERGMFYEEIEAKWASPVARNLGTEGHLAMENFFNGEAVYCSPELEAGLVFAREVMAKLGIVGYRCEFEVYAVEEDIAGSIDFLAKNVADDTFHIFDWKRAKKLTEIFPAKFAKKLKEPFKHIVESDVPVYSFQLSAYMFIIEKYLKLHIESLALVSIMPEKPWWTFCPYLRFETEFIMQQRRLLIAKRITAQLVRPTLPVCEKSGLLAYDAVVTEDGSRIFNETYHRLDASLPPAKKDAPAALEARGAARSAIYSVVSLKVSQEEKNLNACKRDFASYMGPDGVQAFTPCRSF